MPERIQRKRQKGWRLPPNTVCVTRPGKWGNVFSVVYRMKEMGMSEPDARANAVDSFRRCLLETDSPNDPDAAERMEWMKKNLHLLKGKNLACWCPPGRRCHADVLLEAVAKL